MGLIRWWQKRDKRKRLRASYPRENENIPQLKEKLDSARAHSLGTIEATPCPFPKCKHVNRDLHALSGIFKQPIIEDLCGGCRRPVLYQVKVVASPGCFVSEVKAHACPQNMQPV